MLLDSAKDPLHFSVIHFKHPKQPHTVQVSVVLPLHHLVIVLQELTIIDKCLFQAKTVEEKRLWARHIRRLILENHHTIVPQKVNLTAGIHLHLCQLSYSLAPSTHINLLLMPSSDFCLTGKRGHPGKGFSQ